MKKGIFYLMTICLILSLSFCGGKKEESQTPADQPSDKLAAHKLQEMPKPNQTETEQKEPQMTVRNPNAPPQESPFANIARGPEIFPDKLVAGTPEYACYWFAEYFTTGDSTNAIALCSDSMKQVVRAYLSVPKKVEDLKRNRMAGYQLISAAKALDSCSHEICNICLKAKFLGETRDDCNFKFKKINGQWKLISFGE